MIKKILLVYLLSITTALAGLPPTTLSGQSQAKKTTFNFKTPYSQTTTTTDGGLIETGNENMFVNPGFEASSSTGLAPGWLNSFGTESLTTVAGEFSSGKQAQKIALTAQALTYNQIISTPLGIQKQGVAGIIYRVPSNVTDFTICTRVDSADQTCVPSNRLINDDKFHSIEIPIVFGSSTAGLVLKTGSSVTANIYIDGAYLKQGIGFQNISLDDVYSAQVSSAGVVSGENIDWINGNAVISSVSLFTLTYKTGIFTAAPNCQASLTEAGTNALIRFQAPPTNTAAAVFTLHQIGGTQTAAAVSFTIECQKSGSDYLAASASVYGQASANYGRTAYTPTFTGFGTVTGVECFHARDNSDLILDCKWTGGTSTAVESRISLPGVLSTASVSLIPTISVKGKGNVNTSAGTFFGGFTVLVEPSTSYVTLGYEASTLNGLTKSQATSIGSGNTYSFFARIPIEGWTNSNTIVGTFLGVPSVPGYQGIVDTFSVSFGTTNLATVCSASPCFIDQIGTAVSSITRAGVGSYSINTSRSYSKLKCGSTVGVPATTNGLSSNLRCENCSTIPFTTTGSSNTVQVDVTGTLFCQGSY